nr:MAG TPA: hypothetical protein [Caudoviricetes sp.]
MLDTTCHTVTLSRCPIPLYFENICILKIPI